MKKLLAVLMAVLMLGSAVAMGISASAIEYQGYTLQDTEVLVILNFNDATSRDAITYRDFVTGKDTLAIASGTIALVLNAGATYQLPVVTAPEGRAFVGWVDTGTNTTYGATHITTSDADGGKVYQYRCETTVSEAPTDTMATIKTVLIKVFGILLGLFYGDTDYGQELVSSFFESVFGAL